MVTPSPPFQFNNNRRRGVAATLPAATPELPVTPRAIALVKHLLLERQFQMRRAKLVAADVRRLHLKFRNPKSRLILKNAVQPRMDADGHGYQAFTENQWFTRTVNKKHLPKSVFIRG
jgi:hypothetical protein